MASLCGVTIITVSSAFATETFFGRKRNGTATTATSARMSNARFIRVRFDTRKLVADHEPHRTASVWFEVGAALRRDSGALPRSNRGVKPLLHQEMMTRPCIGWICQKTSRFAQGS